MTLQNINGMLWVPSPAFSNLSGVPSFGTAVLDAIDEGLAAMVKAPKTGNITKMLVASRTTTNGATMAGRLEGWDETTTPSQPNGTLIHANASGTLVVANSDDNVSLLLSFAGNVPVTKGDKMAAIFKQPGSSAGNMQIATFAQDVVNAPWLMHNTGASPSVSWAAVSATPIIGFEYDDGSYGYVPHCFPLHAFTTTTFNNSSTPDEIGLRFKLPFPYRIGGFWIWMDPDGDFNVNLYDSDGVTKLFTQAIDKDSARTATGNLQYYPFNSTADLLANTFYRLVLEPSSATNMSMYDFTVRSAAVLDAWEGGQNFHLTSAKNPAAEGDWTNTTTRRPFMGIGIVGLDDGACIVQSHNQLVFEGITPIPY